jgi:hypothetical protein
MGGRGLSSARHAVEFRLPGGGQKGDVGKVALTRRGKYSHLVNMVLNLDLKYTEWILVRSFGNLPRETLTQEA